MKPPAGDPYCLIQDDAKLLWALCVREVCRAVCALAAVGSAVYLHVDHAVLIGGGAAGLVYELFGRQ